MIDPSNIQRRVSFSEFPFRTIVKESPKLIRHNPHPFLVRNVKGFLGLPMQMVESEDFSRVKQPGSVQEFLVDSIRKGEWTFKQASKTSGRKSKDLDSILALQYFTGLRNYSFKEKHIPYLGYKDYFEDWRSNLRKLTECAYEPLIDQKNDCEKIPETAQTPDRLMSRSKSMYSQSGRLKSSSNNLLPSRGRSSQSKRLTPIYPVPKDINDASEVPNLDELDAKIFLILSDILQTQNVYAVQKWLSQSTEKEKALIVSIIQSAVKPEVSNVNNRLIDTATQTSRYPTAADNSKDNKTTKPSIPKTPQVDVLVVDSETTSNQSEKQEIRPPTTATFRPTTNSSKRPQTSTWNQCTSVVQA